MPAPDLNEAKNQIYAITDCIDQSLLSSCHDISDGGIATALSEMTFENNIGLCVTVSGDLAIETLLFTETGGFVIEVGEKCLPQVESILRGYNLDHYNIGTTTKEPKIIINGSIDISVEEAKHLWSNGLRDKIK